MLCLNALAEDIWNSNERFQYENRGETLCMEPQSLCLLSWETKYPSHPTVATPPCTPLESSGILIAPHPSILSFHRSEPLFQVRTQLDKGNTSVSERYKTRLLEPEEVTHCQNLTFRHLGTGSNFPIFMPWLFLLYPEADSFCSKWNFLLNRLFIQNFSSPA